VQAKKKQMTMTGFCREVLINTALGTTEKATFVLLPQPADWEPVR
jgi:hypothetical protein